MRIKFNKYGLLAFIIVAFQILYDLPSGAIAFAKMIIILITIYFLWIESLLKTNFKVLSKQISLLFFLYLISLFFSSFINIGTLDYFLADFLIGLSVLLIPIGFFYIAIQNFQQEKKWTLLFDLQMGIVVGTFVVLIYVALTGHFVDYFGLGKRFMGLSISPSMIALNANILLSYSLLKVVEKIKFKYLVAVLFSLIMIALSLSKSGIILALLTFVYVAIIKKTYLLTVIVFSLTLGVMLVFLPFEAAFEVLKDYVSSDNNTLETLSGRSDIWEVCQELINAKPLLGYGYNSPVKILPVFYTTFKVDQAHSAYYESMLSVGQIGVLLLAIYILKVFAKCFVFFRIIKSNTILSWLFFVLVIGIVRGSTEASFVQANNIIDIFIFYFSLFILDFYISLENIKRGSTAKS